MTSRKIIYIVAAGTLTVIAIILIATACLLFIGKKYESSETETNSTVVEPTNEIPIKFSNALIVQINYSALWALDISDGDMSVFVTRNWNDSYSSFDFYMKKTVYFGSSDLGKPIRSLSNAYPDLKQRMGIWNTEKIAVDYLNGKLYSIDGWASKINIFDVFGEHYSIVSFDFSDPKDIVLDPVGGVMFILQLSSILKANMDGTSPETLIDRTGISAFAIERDIRKIYWSSIASIESADYAGKNNKIVTEINNIVSSLAVLDDKLFWLYPPYGFDDSTLWSCTIANDVCTGAWRKIFIENAVTIKAYNFAQLEVVNPCKQEIETCQHMCVLTSDRRRSCACTIGWQLKSDLTNCRPVDDFLLYVEENFVKGRILDLEQTVFIEAMLPVKLVIDSLVEKKFIDFDYDARNHSLVFSDDWNLSKIDLKAGDGRVRLGAKAGVDIIPAIDWVTKNLYHIRTARFEGRSSIIVQNMVNFSTVEQEKVVYQADVYEYPKSLVLHPNQGRIFFTIYSSKPGQIFRMNSDGSGLERFGKNFTITVNEIALAIDYSEDILYWFSQDRKKIYRAKLDETDLSVIDVSIVRNPRSISVYNEWIYITNRTSVWRIDKKTGKKSVKIVPKFGHDSKTIHGAKIFSQNLQYVSQDHPCAINNGGCGRYCFAIPIKNDLFVTKPKLQKVCGCNDEEILQSDGKSCTDRFP